MRVWILGAGFSRSLGGPLLGELLSRKKRDDLMAQYPAHEQVHSSEEADAVYRLYHFGRGFPENSYGMKIANQQGQHIWTDAEHFLDYLDAAQESASAERRLSEVWASHISLDKKQDPMPPLKRLANAARIILGAECCGFLHEHDPSLERWEPYVNWAGTLTHNDTIITFNYDTVVECAAEAAEKRDAPLRGRGVHVVTFDRAGDGEEPNSDLELDKAKKGDVPILLKLHGSVDWEPVPGKAHLPFRKHEQSDYCLGAGLDTELSLATPGPSKKRATTGPLVHLWSLAEERIEQATEIIFVGYRFPPSDSQARARLLGAIAGNTVHGIHRADSPDGKRKKLTLRTVLVAEKSVEERLVRLLTYAARAAKRGKNEVGRGTYHIDPTGLYAEDYLSVSGLT